MTPLITQCPPEPHDAVVYMTGVRNGIALAKSRLVVSPMLKREFDEDLALLERHVFRLMQAAQDTNDEPAPETQRSRA